MYGKWKINGETRRIVFRARVMEFFCWENPFSDKHMDASHPHKHLFPPPPSRGMIHSKSPFSERVENEKRKKRFSLSHRTSTAIHSKKVQTKPDPFVLPKKQAKTTQKQRRSLLLHDAHFILGQGEEIT
jgi:hypothetical protein